MSEMGAQLSREQALEILLRIATDRENDMRDRLDAIRVHSKISGFSLTEGQIWSVIAALANGGTGKFFLWLTNHFSTSIALSRSLSVST
jgi:hypothetical protein